METPFTEKPLAKPIAYVPQVNPPVQSTPYPNTNVAKKSLPSSTNFTPPARNIQSQLGRPPSTHVDDFEKTKISIKPQIPQQEVSENKEKETTPNNPSQGDNLVIRTPSPTKLKDHHQMVYFNLICPMKIIKKIF